jgi:peptidoglycan/xylan/chitin deacetylase (PgdA/CDA1 family)
VALLLSINAGLVAASFPMDPSWVGGSSPSIAAATAGAAGTDDGVAAASTPDGSIAILPTAALTPAPALTPIPAPTPTPASTAVPQLTIPPGLDVPTPLPTPTPRPTPIPYREYHVPILMYHRVVPTAEAGNSAPGLVVSPELFSAQMQALFEAGWRTITLRDLAEAMRNARTLPPRTFAITFDDGWSDGYDYAYPIMQKYGYVGVFFVISGRINQPGAMTSEQLVELDATGNEIGNHTVDHLSLSTLTFQRAKEEIDTASAQIAQAIHKRPTSLAYPMGGVADYVVRAVSECDGLEIAVTTHPGVTESWLYRLATPRIRVSPTSKPGALVRDLTVKTGL